MFVIDDKFKKIIMMQVTNTPKDRLSFYTTLSESEYQVIKDYLTPYPKKILELGCGLGRMSIFLNKKHPSDSKYYLADASIVTTIDPKKDRYGWDPGTWYNDLELTKQFCENNDLVNFEVIDLAVPSLTSLRDIDFVFSVLSVGFHYPIEQYLDELKLIMKPDGLLIFGVRKGMYDNSPILEKFKWFEFRETKDESKEKFLILKGWK